tara:strand:+ start:89 stop:484 length:396 start_codon:yes stop_codon:yes gene_type:complete
MKLIWTNGCFDVLHRGHVELFKYCKSLGGELYVGIDSDEKAKADKGRNRPFNTSDDRRELLLSLRFIDKVFIFEDSRELRNIIKELRPHTMVIGSDWKNKKVVGADYAQNLVFFDRIPQYSTTKILEWESP